MLKESILRRIVWGRLWIPHGTQNNSISIGGKLLLGLSVRLLGKAPEERCQNGGRLWRKHDRPNERNLKDGHRSTQGGEAQYKEKKLRPSGKRPSR